MTATEQVQTEVRAEGEREHEERFKWREWLHHPEGAVGCKDATNGKCHNSDHFHAICRLPNPWQHDDIVEKAQAARARRSRMMRDTESDPRVILEDELAEIADAPKEILVDELVDEDFAEDYTNAVREVLEYDEPNFIPTDDEPIPKLYAHIEQDREEYLRQRELPEDQHGDDFGELESTFNSYGDAVREELSKIQTPKKEHLMSLDMGELIGMVRRRRMEQSATQAYLQTYVMWQMYLGTVKPTERGEPGKRVWATAQDMRENGAPEVVLAVRAVFDHLDAQNTRGDMGKGG